VARGVLAFGAATKTGSAVVVALTGTANAPQFTGRWQVDLVSPGLPAQPFHAAAALEPIAAEALVVQVGQATEEAAAAALRSAVGGSPVIGVAVVVKMVSIRGEVKRNSFGRTRGCTRRSECSTARPCSVLPDGVDG